MALLMSILRDKYEKDRRLSKDYERRTTSVDCGGKAIMATMVRSEWEMIECAPRALTCSVEACARDWQRAQARKPFPWESRWHCRGCAEGAARAGQPVARGLEVGRLDGVLHTCTRCHRRTDRIVQRFCLSCYNRERELQTGRNGKGSTPVLLQARYPVRTWRLRFRDAHGGWQWRQPVDRVVDALEAMFVLMRQERALLTFARVVPDGTDQFALWGGL